MILLQKHITRSEVTRNSWVTYVFGDNDERKGYGGQAKAMRGLPNAIGIRTKKHPSLDPDAFYTDKELADNIAKIDEDLDTLQARLNAGNLVIMPMDGVGTGYAFLRSKAPQTFTHLNNRLHKMLSTYANPDTPKEYTVSLTDFNKESILPKAIDPKVLERNERLLHALLRVDGVIWSENEIRRIVKKMYGSFVGNEDYMTEWTRRESSVIVKGSVDKEA